MKMPLCPHEHVEITEVGEETVAEIRERIAEGFPDPDPTLPPPIGVIVALVANHTSHSSDDGSRSRRRRSESQRRNISRSRNGSDSRRRKRISHGDNNHSHNRASRRRISIMIRTIISNHLHLKNRKWKRMLICL